MKKILLSLSVIAFVGVAAVGATGAFFSDTETSTGNTFTAGAIDLKVDNHSYYNGDFSPETSWELADLEDGVHFFFNFDDLKPGDWGEDTISLHVNDNDAWVCSDTTLTSNQDNSCTEPENDANAENGQCDTNNGQWSGDLAQEIEIMWWADDGDNVYENDESIIDSISNLGQALQGTPVVRTLADSYNNIWTDIPNDPLDGATTMYVAKAWCFGDLGEAALTQGVYSSGPAGDNDSNGTAGQPEDGGFTCTGASIISNASQSDSATLDVRFTAEQSRNNEGFVCE